METIPIYVDIDPSDNRCEVLYYLFKKHNIPVFPLTPDSTHTNQISFLIFPPAKRLDLEHILHTHPESKVFAGNITKDCKTYMEDHHIHHMNYLTDAEFCYDNARPTADGCIKLIIENTPKSMSELHCLVLGYGKVGKTLAKYLKGLDAITYIYSIDAMELAMANVFADGIWKTLNNLSQFDVIINTIPANILTPSHMESIKKDCYICDLATGTNMDIDFLTSLGILSHKAPGLPGKIAPLSAARYMYDYVMRTRS